MRPCSRRLPRVSREQRRGRPRRRRSCGSSSSTRSASCTSVRASSTRWRWPPESCADLAAGRALHADGPGERVHGPAALACATAAAASRPGDSEPCSATSSASSGKSHAPGPAAACSRSGRRLDRSRRPPGGCPRSPAAAWSCRRRWGRPGPTTTPAGTSSETSLEHAPLGQVDRQTAGRAARAQPSIGSARPRIVRGASRGPRRSARTRPSHRGAHRLDARSRPASRWRRSRRRRRGGDGRRRCRRRRLPRPPRCPASSANPSSRQRSTAR